MNFCVDCKHWSPPSNVHNPYGDCNSPELINENICVVYGKSSRSVGGQAEDVRHDESKCGMKGKWFEKK